MDQESSTMCSRRPYLIRPYYDWIVDSKGTPYISVEATIPGTKVPEKFVKDGHIVLNIKPAAVRDLKIDHKAVSFRATFSGVEESIYIPLLAIRAIYNEHQDGIVFDEQDDEKELPPEPIKPTLRIVE